MNLEDKSRIVQLVEKLGAENARLEDKLDKIKIWCKAYPLEQFPKMEKSHWTLAKKALSSVGLHLGRISADNMRHVLKGVQKIIEE